jgi:hypothetical protein
MPADPPDPLAPAAPLVAGSHETTPAAVGDGVQTPEMPSARVQGEPVTCPKQASVSARAGVTTASSVSEVSSATDAR